MKEILFRGKRIDNGEWVDGYYYESKISGCFILSPKIKVRKKDGVVINDSFEVFEVIPETVGQFTGLTDKNDKKIFEGDIVHAVYQVGYVGCKNVDYGIGVVKYCASYYGGASYEIDIIGDSGSRVFTASLENGVEVIGNIHDNPELIGGEENV